MPVPSKDYGLPHTPHERAEWWPRAETMMCRVLQWEDVCQLSVFGRSGYFVNALLFATVPVNEPTLEVWMRLSTSNATELAKNPRACEHVHPVQGWMRLCVDTDDQIDEAVNWMRHAYDDAIKLSREGRGVPIETVPEPTGISAHQIPHGPRSGRFALGLTSEISDSEGLTESNTRVRDLP